MSAATQTRAAAIKRLAGMANVVGALLAVLDDLEPSRRQEAMATCAGMADDIAGDLADLVGGAL